MWYDVVGYKTIVSKKDGNTYCIFHVAYKDGTYSFGLCVDTVIIRSDLVSGHLVDGKIMISRSPDGKRITSAELK